MVSYVLDTFALVAFFRAEKGADEIEKLLVDALTGRHHLYLCSYNAGEVYYAIWRKTENKWQTPAVLNYYNFK